VTPEEWSRVKELFAWAVDLTLDERDQYLQKEYGGDEGLGAQLSALLSPRR
jgi:hypothetical protein